MDRVVEELGVSQRRACRVLDQPRSSQRYQRRVPDDEEALVKRMLELARRYPRYGYRRITALLRAEQWRVNRKRVYRLWRREGLKVPQNKRKKRAVGHSANGCACRRPVGKNDVWAWDFVFDHTVYGSTLKWLTIVDEYTRECLALKVDRSITGEQVIDTVAELIAQRGAPRAIRSDNGSEFLAEAMVTWMRHVGIDTLYIEPGSPWENGYAESFNSKFRDEFLLMEEFESVRMARRLAEQWKQEYNHYRPHSALGYLAPAVYAAGCAVGSETLSETGLKTGSPSPRHSSTHQAILS